MKSGGCKPIDAPRGSGTAIASYFIAFADPGLSRRLCDPLRSDGRVCALGVLRHPRVRAGPPRQGRRRPGPMLMGVSVGATGFALGAARAHGDADLFRELYRSAHLAGVPVGVGGQTKFAAGGALGNALLLACWPRTASPPRPPAPPAMNGSLSAGARITLVGTVVASGIVHAIAASLSPPPIRSQRCSDAGRAPSWPARH